MHFDIGKQKVVWILKCKDRDKEAAGNALSNLNFNCNAKSFIQSM